MIGQSGINNIYISILYNSEILAYYLYFVCFKDLIYLFMRDTQRGRDPGRGRSRLHVGLDPGSPGSGPGPKAGAQPPSLSGIPILLF